MRGAPIRAHGRTRYATDDAETTPLNSSPVLQSREARELRRHECESAATHDQPQVLLRRVQNKRFRTWVITGAEQDGHIARIRACNFSREVIQEVGAVLGLVAG